MLCVCCGISFLKVSNLTTRSPNGSSSSATFILIYKNLVCRLVCRTDDLNKHLKSWLQTSVIPPTYSTVVRNRRRISQSALPCKPRNLSKAETQVRWESQCWYQQGGRTILDDMRTQTCPAHVHLHLAPIAVARSNTRKWKRGSVSRCCAFAREGTVPSKHCPGPGPALGVAGPGTR